MELDSALDEKRPASAESFSWTDDRTALLKRRVVEKASAAQIAAELGPGVSRSAVLGKIHRLGLSGDKRPGPKPMALTPAKPLKALAPLIVPPPTPERPPAERGRGINRGVELVQLRNDDCRWPIGSPGGEEAMRYCGGPVTMATRKVGLCYCATHMAQAYQPRRGHSYG